MYKLMIVDDEYMILEGMKCLLNYEALHVEIVHATESAIEAINYVNENPVDIIITDVNMPGMSGLEMIKQLRERGEKIDFIVMSGYQEFDYVKQSIALNVKNYLVKPIDKQELENELFKIIQQKQKTSHLFVGFLKGYPIAIENVLKKLPSTNAIYLVASHQTVPAIVSAERHVLGQIIHFSLVDTYQEDTYIYCEKLTVNTSYEVFKTYVEKLLFYGKIGKHQNNLWNIYDDIYPTILSGQISEFLEKLPAIQQEISEATPDVHLTQQIFIQLLMDVYQYFNRIGHEDLQTLFTSVKQYTTLTELVQFVSGELLHMMALHQYSSNVKKVLTIISQEYQADLTLKLVSQRLFVNTVYLGQIIKKETALTFAELLNKQRIKVAQQLLLGTTDSIDMICYKVGYSNVGYFYKTFKRLCGESPKVYRKQILDLQSDLQKSVSL